MKKLLLVICLLILSTSQVFAISQKKMEQAKDYITHHGESVEKSFVHIRKNVAHEEGIVLNYHYLVSGNKLVMSVWTQECHTQDEIIYVALPDLNMDGKVDTQIVGYSHPKFTCGDGVSRSSFSQVELQKFFDRGIEALQE